MTLRSSDLQSDGDLHSICNSSDDLFNNTLPSPFWSIFSPFWLIPNQLLSIINPSWLKKYSNASFSELASGCAISNKPFLWSAAAINTNYLTLVVEMVSLTSAHLLGRMFSLYVYKYSENKARKRIIGSGFVSMKLLDCTWCFLWTWCWISKIYWYCHS